MAYMGEFASAKGAVHANGGCSSVLQNMTIYNHSGTPELVCLNAYTEPNSPYLITGTLGVDASNFSILKNFTSIETEATVANVSFCTDMACHSCSGHQLHTHEAWHTVLDGNESCHDVGDHNIIFTNVDGYLAENPGAFTSKPPSERVREAKKDENFMIVTIVVGTIAVFIFLGTAIVVTHKNHQLTQPVGTQSELNRLRVETLMLFE